MKNIFYKVKDKSGITGEAMISFMIIVIVVMALLVLSLSFFGMYTKISRVNAMAQEIMRIAEIKGHTGITAQIENIKAASGIDNVSISLKGDYIAGTNRVQLGGSMSVTVKATSKVGVGNIVVINIPITGKAIGISEQYWK